MKQANTARDSEIALWLSLLSGQTVSRRLAKTLINAWCVRDQQPLAALFETESRVLAESLEMPTEAIGAVQQALRDPTGTALLSRLYAANVQVITRVDAAFPDELATHLDEESVPYLLFALGPLENLADSGVAVGGHSEAQALDAEMMRRLAGTLASAGRHVIGGFDSGADRELLLSSASSGGRATAILPMGLLQAEAVISLANETVGADRLLLLSPFQPDAAFDARLGQARRPLVTALADSLLLIEPDQGPQQWPSTAQLAATGRPVVVLSRSDAEPVRQWLAQGARLAEDESAVLSLLAGADAPTEALSAQGPDALPGVEPIFFEDADDAIQTLSQTGRVPPALEQRLRESSLFGYQDYPDIDIDPNASESEQT